MFTAQSKIVKNACISFKNDVIYSSNRADLSIRLQDCSLHFTAAT